MKRNRVLLATLGGEGFLYSYDHKNKTWTVVSSLDNVDVTAIAYVESLDRIFAIGFHPLHGSERELALNGYETESGKSIRHRPIDVSNVGEFIDRGLQLIPIGDSLVFAQMPKSKKDGVKPVLPIIDPKTAAAKEAE